MILAQLLPPYILYGHCNNHLKSRHCSKKTYIKEDEVNKQISAVFEKIAPKNEAVLKWIEDIILQENAEQVKFRETELQRINGLLTSIRKQKDKYFEAKINREVDLDYCDKKIKECKEEEAELESLLNRVVTQSDEYQELRLVVHELAFKAKKIYEIADVDDKKLLLSQLFTNFSQNLYEIKPNYNLASEYLLEWVPKLNEVYEQQKTLSNTMSKGFPAMTHYSSPILLRG